MKKLKIFSKLFILMCIINISIYGCTKKNKATAPIIRFTDLDSVHRNKVNRKLLDIFRQDHPNIRIKFEPQTGGAGYLPKLMAMFVSGTAPDVITMTGDRIGDLINRGVVLDITSYIQNDPGVIKNMYEPLVKEVTFSNRVYGLPTNCGSDVLYYNKAFFDNADILYPDSTWTFDTMAEAGIYFTKSTQKKVLKNIGVILGIPVPQYILAFGGDIWNDTGSNCIINNREAKTALQYLYYIKENKGICPKPEDTQAQMVWDIFSSGRAAMYLGAHWIKVKFIGKKDFRFGVSLTPKAKCRVSRFVGNVVLINAKTKHPDESFELIKFFSSPRANKEWVKIGDSVPLHKSGEAHEAFLNDKKIRREDNIIFLKNVKYAYDLREIYNVDISFAKQQEMFIRIFEEVMIGRISVSEALARLQDRLNKMHREEKI